LEAQRNCEVCNTPLNTEKNPVTLTCTFCGKKFEALSFCPHGHHVCAACRKLTVPEVLEKVITSSNAKSPVEILEKVMAHPGLAMHGADHHYIFPVVIIAAAKNAGYAVPVEALQQAMQRGQQVPGGWCGFCGACGAAVGVGIATGALIMSTPLNGRKRTLVMDATREATARMEDNEPRCCKKDGRIAMETAVEFLNAKIGTRLEKGEKPVCTYYNRNKECVKQACKYYPATA
jgi:7,8-dihydro-6-hydroxymethylpterin dimethyltransferase